MWEQIAANKRRSYLLFFLMFLFLGLVGYVIGRAWGGGAGGFVGLGAAGILATVMSLTGYFSGDKIILAVSGAKRIEKTDNPQLFNVVEEMTIASGLPMPKIHVIDDSAPNAFATGRNPEHSSVAITQGLLDKLSRDELQGVMAHELSHIKNYDILFAMLMCVRVGTVALLSDFFLRSTFWGRRGTRRRSSRGGQGGAQALIFILAIVLAILAPIFAKLIQLAMSRQREYLADASAAQATRYPEGLASALEKIAGDREVLEVANRATQHLYIVNPMKSFEARAKGLFSTHPPIGERIKKLRSM